MNNEEAQHDSRINEIWHIMQSNPKAFDPRFYLPPIMDTVMFGDVPNESVRKITELIESGVKEVVGKLVVDFGQVGKMSKVEIRTLDEMAEYYRKEGI